MPVREGACWDGGPSGKVPVVEGAVRKGVRWKGAYEEACLSGSVHTTGRVAQLRQQWLDTACCASACSVAAGVPQGACSQRHQPRLFQLRQVRAGCQAQEGRRNPVPQVCYASWEEHQVLLTVAGAMQTQWPGSSDAIEPPLQASTTAASASVCGKQHAIMLPLIVDASASLWFRHLQHEDIIE